MNAESEWLIYRGSGEPHDDISRLPEPPPWRRFDGVVGSDPPAWNDSVGTRPGATDRARVYQPSQEVVELVNAALYLRRPLLVTGKPGTGKSTLALSVAYELKLGPVLTWPISSHSKLTDGLYHYDPIGRLEQASLERDSGELPDIGRYVRLGALGTALVPSRKPRVLLIDEFDKSDIDLPNDLLNVFEEGGFEIPELSRLPDDQGEVEVFTADPRGTTGLEHGFVRCNAFPFVVITSNGERDFPPAFLRRCLRLNIQQPDAEKLAAIVEGHLGADALEDSRHLVNQFVERRDFGELATDQLLNAIYLTTSGARPETMTRERLTEKLFQPLDGSVGSG